METMIGTNALAKQILYNLHKGNLKWEDEIVQFFLPVGLHFTNFDLLRVAAENTLVEEDNKVVQDFLSKVESIMEINADNLDRTVKERMLRGMEDL